MRDGAVKSYTVPAALFIAVILLPFFEPNMFFDKRMLDLAYTGVMAAVAFTAAVLYVGRMRVSPAFLIICVYRLWTLAAGIYSTGRVDKAWVSRTAFMIGLFAVVELCLEMDERSTLTAIFVIVFAYLLLNCTTVFLFKPFEGAGKSRYFGGLRTRFSDFTTIAVFLSMLLSYRGKKRLLSAVSLVTFAVAAAQLIYVSAITGIIITAGIFMLALFYEVTHKPIPSVLLIFGPLILNFMLVFTDFKILVSDAGTFFFNKKAGLNGRFEIWEKFIREAAWDHYLGAGENGNGGAVSVGWTGDLVPGHNTLIQLLYDSGIPGIILLVLLVIVCYLAIRRCRDRTMAYIAATGMAAVGLLMMTEVVQYFDFVWLMPVVVVNISRLGLGKEPKRAVFLTKTGSVK